MVPTPVAGLTILTPLGLVFAPFKDSYTIKPPRVAGQARHTYPCQYQLKIPHYSGRKFPSPRQVVVYSFGW